MELSVDEAGEDDSAAERETSVIEFPDDVAADRVEAMRKAFAPEYQVVDMLGRGGMGLVYRARQVEPERSVVLKVMPNGRFAHERELKRFRREVQAIARLRHPGIVSVYECGCIDGMSYFSMEYVDGIDLREYVLRQQLHKREVVDLVLQLTKSVAYAHEHGVVHRDIKPANVLVTEDGNPHLLDFGLARVGDPSTDGAVTQPGEVLGTPSYMSPEQVWGGPWDVDGRSDIYSIGVLLYELLTDQLPYVIDRSRPLASLRMVREYIPARPSEVDSKLDRDLDAIVMKCLEKDPRQRYQSASELVNELGRYLRGEPVEARPCTSLYYLRKMVWRNRSVVLPIAGALLFAGVLLGLHFLSTDASGAETRGVEEASVDIDSLRPLVDEIMKERDLQSDVAPRDGDGS